MHVSDEDAARAAIARLQGEIEKERADVIRRIDRDRAAGVSSDFRERMKWDYFNLQIAPMQKEVDVIVGLLAQKRILEAPQPFIMPRGTPT